MSNLEAFTSAVEKGYAFEGNHVTLGGAVLDGIPVKGLHVKAPLRMFNRHGLVAGATGTGKTKTLQALAESLSANGVSTLMMDIKGDISGISQLGIDNPTIAERSQKMGIEWKPDQFPVEFLTISAEKGTRLRATISEFGPILLTKILELNDTQGGLVAMVFKYCDDKQLPLLDIKDFRKTLQYISNEGKDEVENAYGLVSSSSVGAVMRKLLEIEGQGADVFFGEISFEVDDLVRLDEKGRGTINILRLTDIQSKPKLFSSFMLCLLAEIYQKFPERGDKDDPELVIFIDEAHLIFEEASKALNDQIETIIKLIRSKGVGIFFCTQSPMDIPEGVLGQLGMKIQHALRAFTPKDRVAIKKTSENYPITEFYKTEDLLTQLGIGEALVTVLNEKGIPTPLVHCMMITPRTRMDIITEAELTVITNASSLAKKYNQEIDRESAFEMLTEKLKQAAEATERLNAAEKYEKQGANGGHEKSIYERVAESKYREIIVKEAARRLLGVIDVSGTRIEEEIIAFNNKSDEKNKSDAAPKIEGKVSERLSQKIVDEALKDLNSLTGLTAVKEEIKSLINFIIVQKAREDKGFKSSSLSYHIVFTGNPGTGKTTVARIIAKIYKALGVLQQGQLIETDRSGLIAEYVGQTAVKVNKTVDSALNGVLFIDEAYSIVGDSQDSFGKEAVSTLIKRMEDDRDKLIVILAGYTKEMQDFIETNPGFKSRFNRYIDFADYQPDELLLIFEGLCKKLDYKITDNAKTKLTNIFIAAYNNRDKSFGNGRFVRNTFEKSLERQANRIATLADLTDEVLTTITADDLPDK